MQKHHNIEFLRIVFSIIIVYFHILHSNIMKYVNGNTNYIELARLSDNAGWIVECFFVMSGYFLYQGIVEGKKQHNITLFVIKKVFRLGPVLWFSILLGIFFFKQSVYPSVFNSVFLQCVGLSLEYKGINWFVSPLFWGLIFFYCLLKPPINSRQVLFGGQ